MTFFRKLTSFDDDLDFRKGWRIGITVSIILLIISGISLVTQGLNLGIDFRGGTVWEVPAKNVTVVTVRNSVKPLGEGDATIQIVGSNHVRVEARPKDDATRAKTTQALAKVTGAKVTDISVSTVGPTWGKDVSQKALRALIFFFLAVALYISLRLEWRMAVGALVAMVHDVLISVGVYSIFQWEVTPGTVVAFLTILGYSLYDTIVVYDKVADNTRRLGGSGKMTYTQIMNLSLNQVIMRSLNTTFTALLPVVSILVIGAELLGATALQEFGLALAVGLFVGAYSSVFVASPLVAWLKEREPRYRQIRERLEGRSARLANDMADSLAGTATPDLVGADAGSGALAGSTTRTPTGGTYSANHPPRPRKKGKKR